MPWRKSPFERCIWAVALVLATRANERGASERKQINSQKRSASGTLNDWCRMNEWISSLSLAHFVPSSSWHLTGAKTQESERRANAEKRSDPLIYPWLKWKARPPAKKLGDLSPSLFLLSAWHNCSWLNRSHGWVASDAGNHTLHHWCGCSLAKVALVTALFLPPAKSLFLSILPSHLTSPVNMSEDTLDVRKEVSMKRWLTSVNPMVHFFSSDFLIYFLTHSLIFMPYLQSVPLDPNSISLLVHLVFLQS